MSDRRCFECLDRTLKDILDNAACPFGGKSVLLGGDFRQTLPVKPKSTRSEIIASSLPMSYLWQFFKVYKLNENIRVRGDAQNPTSMQDSNNFASWLLDIGNGLVGDPDVQDPQNTRTIQIPSNFLIDPGENGVRSLINFVYDEFILNYPSAENLSNRAIVCPKNETADEINKIVLNLTPGETRSYISYDSMVPYAQNTTDVDALYPQEYLNELSFPGIPPHRLDIKINTPVMLIRNINQTLGLCNGTRLLISQLLPTIIEARIITGTSIGSYKC
ncbi:putative DNA helicase Pif1, P-loop containing nucleoside triphosphate hydrolase [Helianthus annuus]|nr:putative DNA helicase Pif1, P-loop containing nucleoside triphosphate hydrolase [Helianthus annuus]